VAYRLREVKVGPARQSRPIGPRKPSEAAIRAISRRWARARRERVRGLCSAAPVWTDRLRASYR